MRRNRLALYVTAAALTFWLILGVSTKVRGYGVIGAFLVAATGFFLIVEIRYVIVSLRQRDPKRASVLKRSGMALLMVAPLAGGAAIEIGDVYSRHLILFSEAMQKVESSSAAKEELGEPIKVGWPVRVSSQDSVDTGYAILAIPVSGSKSHATLNVRGTKTGGSWEMERISLDPSDSHQPSISLTATP